MEKKIAIQITRIEYYNKEGELAVYSDEQLPMYYLNKRVLY